MRVGHPGNNPNVQSTDVAKKADRAVAPKRTDATDKAGAAGAAAQTAKADGGARAEISAKAREMADAKALAAKTPEVREDRVAELKRKISEGKYNVDADKIADRLVNEHMASGGA